MTDTDAAESPLAAAADGAGTSAVGAFSLLGSETRLAILLALWEAHDPRADSDGVSFSELRDRVGVSDTGQFNYHLGKLVGEFVRKTDDGYALRPVGLGLVRTVVAGTGAETTLPPTDVDVACHRCGAGTSLTYRGGWLYHRCTECSGEFGYGSYHPAGLLFAEPFPAAAVEDRPVEEIFAAGVVRLLAVLTMKLGGICPQCSGSVDSTMTVCGSHESPHDGVCPDCGNAAAVRLHWVCSVCKYEGAASPGSAAIVHPAVIAFYSDHGIGVGYPAADFEGSKRALACMRAHEVTLVSTDPLRVRVRVRVEDDELDLLFDDRMRLVAE